MPIVPFEHFRHLENMRRELDRFFTTDFPALRTGFDQKFGAPSIDIHETENEIVATCDIPGIEKKEDINIDIDNNILSVSGTINRQNEVKEENMHRQERFVGRFNRSVTLPSPVSSEGVRASYKNGVLEIHVPKITNGKKKGIDVQFH